MDAQDRGTVPGLAAPGLAHQAHLDLAPLGALAASALVTPANGKAPDAANVEGLVHTQTQLLILDQPADDGKRFATLRAHLALNGYSLNRTAAGDGPVGLSVTRWDMARDLRDLAAVARFRDQVGGAHA